jgi:hypothetical protein
VARAARSAVRSESHRRVLPVAGAAAALWRDRRVARGTGTVGQRGLGAIREQGGLTYAEEALVADFVFRPAAIAREIAWLGRDRSLGAGLRRVGAAHAPDVRHILRLPTDDREVLRAEQQSLTTVNEELESLLDSLDLPMVIVDGERCVRRFTSSARRMVNVIASDIGRPIGDIRWNVRRRRCRRDRQARRRQRHHGAA